MTDRAGRSRAPWAMKILVAAAAATVTSPTFAGFAGLRRPDLRTQLHAESTVSETGVTQENFETPGWRGPKGRRIPKGFETWTDYTRFALEGIKVHGPVGPSADDAKNRNYRPMSLVDRKRSMGVDFGPKFCGLAMSLGGVNSAPMGTLRTGEDWKELAIKITQIASTHRIKDIVVGQPLQRDGSEGKIGKLVRYFVQILADSCLLLLGNEVTVFMWDERFSTQYAAMRLANRPKFDGAMFKKWIDTKVGLNWGGKALLDAEAARAILEHWLAKDERLEIINKELSERVPPSRQACIRYLKYRKVRALLPEVEDEQPEEPAGEGKEGWEWFDAHPDSYNVDDEGHEQAVAAYRDYMKGLDGFGSKEAELQQMAAKRAQWQDEQTRIKASESSAMLEALQRKAANSEKGNKGIKLPKEKWSKYR